MERRDFLAAMAAAATAASRDPLGAAGLPPVPNEDSGAGDEMTRYVRRVDAGMQRIAEWSATKSAPDFSGDRAATDALARNAFQSMFLVGMFGDLPLEKQLHEGMQQRMEDAMPMFDDAVDGMQAFVASRTEDDLARVHAALRADGVQKKLVDAIVTEAERTGVSDKRSKQLRKMLDHVAWRLANQPPQLVITEYAEKMKRVAEADIAIEARQRRLAAQLAEDAFWAADQSVRQRRINKGAKTMGVGLLITGVGGAIVAAGAFPGVFIMTAGVVTMIVGLFILIVGLATSDTKTTQAAQ